MEDVMTALASPASVPATISVPLAEVEREVSRQMQAHQGAVETPVLRARMSNLVIFCNGRELAEGIASQVPEILAVHPARVLLLVEESGPENAEITAEIQVRPQRLGNRQVCCSEQVTLRAAGPAVDRLPFAVRTLVIGDLPINLWWASPQPPALAGPLLYELAEHAQQIMYDSLGWTEPARGVAATATWLEQIERGSAAGRWRVASDLNWRRLKYWRRLLSQALDPDSAPGAAESASEIVVEHGPHAVIQAWQLVSWLARQLGWRLRAGQVQPGVEISWRLTSAHTEPLVRIRRLDHGPPEIRRVSITCKLDGNPVVLNLVAESDVRLAIMLEGVDAAPRTMTIPKRTPAEIVGRQLSDREPDPVFRESMAMAQRFAQSLL
jgi:glucose-6-phosphate dehydrogenase assembly protein OpcA